MQKLLIVGCGDVAQRALPLLLPRYRIYALVRRPEQADAWRQPGVTPILADLDQPASLQRLAGLADLVLHLAPPPNRGTVDTRTQHLLAALARGKSLPQRLTYISTTGIYGDCGGAWVSETRPGAPATARGQRRLDGEQQLRAWGARTGVTVTILRAPGIYAAERLPRERLAAGTPALRPEDDVFTNHIHGDDLAGLCALALRRGGANRCYNACDDGQLTMGDYFTLVARHLGLPPPPRISRQEAEQRLSPLLLSFMSESRRLCNRRIKAELGYRLRYPDVSQGLAGLGHNTPLA